MTLLLWITTAICFVGWIWRGVCASMARRERDHAEECWREAERLRDELYKKYGTKCDALRESKSDRAIGEMKLAHVETDREELRETLTRVAEAVKKQKTAGAKLRETRTQLYEETADATVYLDEFIAEYAGEETKEPEPGGKQ